MSRRLTATLVAIPTLLLTVALASCTGGSATGAGADTATAANPTTAPQAAPTPAPARLGAYVGSWHLHGATLVITRDRTGIQTTNIGECFPDPEAESTAMCNQIARLTFAQPTADGIKATVSSVEYKEWGKDTAPEGYRSDPSVGLHPGDSFTLTPQGPNTLHTTWHGHHEHLNTVPNPNWCRNGGPATECGA